ncbi:uncharacterized protein PHACADRAFT_253415 [Phanerochaete carnosa HHB-10118-sp]|uniref:Uncharacterized protein n=1 Tax=Phanerochaete carnosa (strain HHB-10118-sp) TaxID=650164 RepID=K5VXR2_PHACS|nr:uncharacterized protein PHACADRAFT_253415 [Phanerochaete carnosa HHB-10118-sp]EKM56348.1 hypothetical protein PHACADRAFT_253415 [Phanerochaete carnosa HHB-10118-sp]
MQLPLPSAVVRLKTLRSIETNTSAYDLTDESTALNTTLEPLISLSTRPGGYQ